MQMITKKMFGLVCSNIYTQLYLKLIKAEACLSKSVSQLPFTSAEQLEVASLLLDLQLQDLLKKLLPEGFLYQTHPLQLLAIQSQQSSA